MITQTEEPPLLPQTIFAETAAAVVKDITDSTKTYKPSPFEAFTAQTLLALGKEVGQMRISIGRKRDQWISEVAKDIVKKVASPDLCKVGLLDSIVQNAIDKSLLNGLNAVGNLTVWVKPKEYMRKYGLTPTTLWRYKQSGKISKNTIRGAGKGRRYNITIPPIC